MRRPRRRAGGARHDRRATGEDLGVDTARSDAPRGEPGRQVLDEARRPAKVEVAGARHPELVEDLDIEASDSVVILSLEVAGARAAVEDTTSPASQRRKQAS